MSTHAIFRAPEPYNEPVHSYAPGAPEREALRLRLQELESQQLDIPLVIGGEEVRTGKTFEAIEPHKRSHVLAHVHLGGPQEVERAIGAAAEAWKDWSRTPWEDRRDLAARRRAARRPVAHDDERRDDARSIEDRAPGRDRFGVRADRLLALQRGIRAAALRRAAGRAPGMWNLIELPPARGLRLRVTPFNFTAIGGNLPTAPALMGNTVVWKPAETAPRLAWCIDEAPRGGRAPAGRHQLHLRARRTIRRRRPRIPTSPACTSPARPTCSSSMWQAIGDNIERYRTYPRSSARPAARTSSSRTRRRISTRWPTAIVRGGYEYQGQKCSAASRVYVPRSCGRDEETSSSTTIKAIKHRRRRRLLELHGRGDQERVRQARDRDRRGEGRSAHEGRLPAAAATTATATSCSRR